MQQLTSLVFTSVVAMATLTGCAGQEAASQQQVTGSLSYLARIALAPNSVAEVTVRDTRVADGAILAQQRIELDGQSLPIPFKLAFNSQASDSGAYSVTAEIKEGDRVSWRSAPIGVSGEPGLTDLGNLVLQQVAEYEFNSLMQCGEQRIHVAFDGEQAQVRLNDQTLTLDQVVAASGARYQLANDSSTELWNKGDKAQLTVKGKAYAQCVSDVNAVLQGSAWRVTNLNGEHVAVPAEAEVGAEAKIHFGEDGRVYGRAFCNSFTGGYQLQGDTLSTTELASTMMLCSQDQMQHERTMLEVLGHAKRIEFNASGSLVIFADDGRTLTAN